MSSGQVDTADIVAITQTLNLYGHLFDKKDWDNLHLVFTEDGIVDYTAAGRVRAEGVEHIKRHMIEVPPSVLAHTSLNVYIWTDNGVMRARSKFLAPVPDGTVFTGLYEDVIVRTAAGWRIKERIVTVRRSLEENL